MYPHPLDLASLVFGLLFMGVGLPFLFGQDLLFIDWSWGWPLLAMIVGGALLLTSRRDRGRSDDG